MSDKRKMYVMVLKRDERPVGHAWSYKRPDQERIQSLSVENVEREQVPQSQSEDPDNESGFRAAITSFSSVMRTYGSIIPLTLSMAPTVSSMMAAHEIEGLSKDRGRRLEDLSCDTADVYELPFDCIGVFMQRHESAVAALRGADHLPEIAIIGLVSVYDAYLSNLLSVVFRLHEEIVLTPDKEIRFDEIRKLRSFDDLKENIIATEAEGILRKSHHDQFSWMESKLKLSLRDGLSSWSSFVEICERRNLLTHTGGVVTRQYLNNCRDHGVLSLPEIGDRLRVEPEYYRKAVQTVGEIGLKLGHVLWRKFAENERESADEELNGLGMDLITLREYPLAERLLELGAKFKKHSSDRVRRMMIINWANSMRLQDNAAQANTILDREDWTSSSIDFQICVSAVRSDIPTLCELVRAEGRSAKIDAENYRAWPVFRKIRRDERFALAFEEVFGEPLLLDSSASEPALQVCETEIIH